MKRAIAALTFAMLTTAPAAADLETVFTFDRATPPGNLAIGPDGRMFMSLHEFYGPELRVVEVSPDGSTKPYPTDAWARAPEGGGDGLSGVLGLNVDRRGVLWMLDGQRDGHAGRVVGWDTRTETLHAIHTLAAPVTRASSFLNDLAIDRENGAIYISDPANGDEAALIVLDLATGRARRVLEGSAFTRAEEVDMAIDGRRIDIGGAPARIGVNPITVDPTNQWVYFAPMSGRSMYRVRTRDLRDQTLSDDALTARVERYGDKPISDGAAIDAAGNVYIAAMADDAIGVTTPDGRYETLFQSAEDLPWPDGFAIGPDGFVYATINELHRSPVLNGGEDGATGAFKIVRFPALADAISGR